MDGLTPQLRALVDAQVFTGFALVTLQGVVGEVVGPLAQDLKPGSLEVRSGARRGLTTCRR